MSAFDPDRAAFRAFVEAGYAPLSEYVARYADETPADPAPAQTLTERPDMQTLKRASLTLALVAIQPLKLVASVTLVAASVAYDVGREFVSDFRSIWTAQ